LPRSVEKRPILMYMAIPWHIKLLRCMCIYFSIYYTRVFYSFKWLPHLLMHMVVPWHIKLLRKHVCSLLYLLHKCILLTFKWLPHLLMYMAIPSNIKLLRKSVFLLLYLLHVYLLLYSLLSTVETQVYSSLCLLFVVKKCIEK